MNRIGPAILAALLAMPTTGALQAADSGPVAAAAPAAADPAPAALAPADAAPMPSHGVPDAAWLAGEWQAYASRFVMADGRVVDNANGNVSHSESQGYGLLLAAKAGDAARFETIWAWTARTLLIRKDGLAAWKWDPAAQKVTDMNNATDGDILIAWGLAEGARRFNRADYRQAAVAIARAVGAGAVARTRSGPVLLPGLKGFRAGEQRDGPVINLSYWIFPAFPVLSDLVPAVDWGALRRSGLALLERSRFGPLNLPMDWESVAGSRPRPAASFPPGFGYNAIRIPLYLAMDGGEDARDALRPFAGPWAASPAQPLEPKTPAVTLPVGDAGYDLVLAVARCVTSGQAIPPEMISRRSDLYYPETLRLLSVITLQQRFQSCL